MNTKKKKGMIPKLLKIQAQIILRKIKVKLGSAIILMKKLNKIKLMKLINKKNPINKINNLRIQKI